jgi:hypothetical protein
MDRGVQDIDKNRAIEVAAALDHPDAHALSGEHPRDEHRLAVYEPQAVAPGNEPGDNELVHAKNRSSSMAQRQ